jgi:hypothetical protein
LNSNLEIFIENYNNPNGVCSSFTGTVSSKLVKIKFSCNRENTDINPAGACVCSMVPGSRTTGPSLLNLSPALGLSDNITVASVQPKAAHLVTNSSSGF